MAWMIYIREIHHSFLHFSPDGESFCLRDFSPSGNGPALPVARQSQGRTTSTIREIARQPGNHLIEIPGEGKGLKEYTFWHEQTKKLNAQFLKSPSPAPAPETSRASWIGENVVRLVVGVITAVVIAVVLAWLGLK